MKYTSSIFIITAFLLSVVITGCSNQREIDQGTPVVNEDASIESEDIENLPQDNDKNASSKGDSNFYENANYGFEFSLPKNWTGYKIVMETWEGADVESNNEDVEYGPKILIRHPEWTAENPRQDIPIMILTLEQWDSLQNGEFHIGAAPISPKELDRNNQYVFAIPARYNFAFPTGYQEVETILENNPLQPTTIGTK